MKGWGCLGPNPTCVMTHSKEKHSVSVKKGIVTVFEHGYFKGFFFSSVRQKNDKRTKVSISLRALFEKKKKKRLHESRGVSHLVDGYVRQAMSVSSVIRSLKHLLLGDSSHNRPCSKYLFLMPGLVSISLWLSLRLSVCLSDRLSLSPT